MNCTDPFAEIDLNDIKDFATDFFATAAIETLVHGNINAQVCRTLLFYTKVLISFQTAMALQDTIERVVGLVDASAWSIPAEYGKLLPKGTEAYRKYDRQR